MKKSEVFQMAATITAGILSNPGASHLATDNWAQQQILHSSIQNTINACLTMGINIEEEEPKP